jgi:sulfur-oxidizing protein SoxX
MTFRKALACGYALALFIFPSLGLAANLVWDGNSIPLPLSDQVGNVLRGKEIVNSRQTGLCVLCHTIPGNQARFEANLAPNLVDSVGQFSSAQLRARLVDASRFNPNTIMPNYYQTNGLSRVAPQFANKTILSAQEIEDVIAYLKTLSP